MEGNTGKNGPIAFAVIAVLWVVFLAFGTPGYLECKTFLASVTHHFFHVNALHLAINSYAIYIMLKRRCSLTEILTGWAIGSLAFFAAASPTIGVSNLLYAVIGLRVPAYSKSWWKNPNTIIFLSVMFAYLFVPHVSALTHIVSFFGGVAVASVVRIVKKTNSDYGKAKTGRRG